MKQRPPLNWKIVLFPVLFPVMLAAVVLLFAVSAVVRVRDFRHIPRGVYPFGFDGDFGVWSRRRACEHGEFADAVENYDYLRMSRAQQFQYSYDKGTSFDPVERYPNDLCRNERGEVVPIVK